MQLGSGGTGDDERSPLVPEGGGVNVSPNRLAALASYRHSISHGQQYGSVGNSSSPTGASPEPYLTPLKSGGVTPTAAGAGKYHADDERLAQGRSGSLHSMSQNADKFLRPPGHGRANSLGNLTIEQDQNEGRPFLMRSHSISGDGSVSYLTPLQMGRHEMYEMVPFIALPGLQRKERNLSMAFASYAAALDTQEADDIVTKMTKEPLSNAEKELHRSNANLLLLEELEMDQALITIPLIFAVIAASASQFLVGYNTGVMNAPESVVFPGHSTASWSIAVAAFAVGGPFGANLAGTLADSRGRRGALMIVVWTFLLGGLIQTLALDMYTIILARFIIGLASGSSSVLVPIYLGEMAPPTLRGTLGTMTQFALGIGILVADLLAFPFANQGSWRILFGITPFLAIVQLLCSPFLLESPRWLLGRDPDSRKARFIIKKLRGFRFDHEVETEVGHFLSAAKVQTMDSQGSTSSQSAVKEMFADRSIRLLVVSAIVLQVAQQFSGVNAIFYYSTMFFQGVIDNPLVGTSLVGAVNVLGTWVALLLMDTCGRRTLILWSSAGMFISCVTAVLALLGYFNNMVALGAVITYIFFFEIGLGPIPWLIVAEMFDARYVTTAMSLCCQINWSCNFIIGLVYPYMNEYLGPYSFGPFAIVLYATFCFVAVILPETGGTTPAELQAELVKRNASVVYHNLDIETNHNSPLDVQWRLAMDKIQGEEEEAMRSGSYNYGFRPIEQSGPTLSQNFSPSSTWAGELGGPTSKGAR